MTLIYKYITYGKLNINGTSHPDRSPGKIVDYSWVHGIFVNPVAFQNTVFRIFCVSDYKVRECLMIIHRAGPLFACASQF